MNAPARAVVRSAQAYARALLPHLAHEGYRCDSPRDGLMGKGCRSCAIETVIAIDDFRATGDLEAFAKELQAGGAKGPR